jgi:succinyl-diaminopimelate desuccinylase
MISSIELTKILIAKESITPNDGGCLSLIADQLRAENFNIEYFNYGLVKNLFACYGDKGPLFVFVGHVDVVPTGPVTAWANPPFIATEKDGFIYGRGSADMKSAVAAMVCALIDFVKQCPSANFRAALLLTSDEEGIATDGIQAVMKAFQQRDIKIDYCLVGEPSSDQKFGDTIKIGRRGTLSGKLTLIGKQGHIAYPQLADNPIHHAATALNDLLQTEWDQGNQYFQPTALQFSNIHAGTGANNVIPGQLQADFNFRFSPETHTEKLQAQFEAVLNKHQLNYTIDWHLGGLPFLTNGGVLLKATEQSISEVTGTKANLSTHGGTSDGRFIAPTGAEVVEFGVMNQTIHQIDECVNAEDIHSLTVIYTKILEKIQEHT